jgi:tripartite-type tricarboxylate transporter receptor subunit TctC
MKSLASFLGAAALACSILFAPVAGAQPAGGQTIRIVVPFAAGGAQDVLGRYFASKLASRLGATVVVENKTGASGVVAADAVAKAAPDGTTLFLATGGAITIAPHLNPRLSYNARKDFAPVALIADTPMTLSVRTQSPYQTIGDVLRDARANPGKVTFGSSGNGSISHLTGELLAQAAGVQLTHVGYRGGSPALVDLLGGQISMIVTSSASIEPMVHDQKARVLATFTREGLPNFRGVPTVTQATGLKGLEVPVWIGILAPARTPQATVEKLAAEFTAVCQLPETQERFRALGALAMCGGSAALEKVVSEDYERWGRVIRQGNIKE